jgi:hypothetical protein
MILDKNIYDALKKNKMNGLGKTDLKRDVFKMLKIFKGEKVDTSLTFLQK